jgi:hypothetical protein
MAQASITPLSSHSVVTFGLNLFLKFAEPRGLTKLQGLSSERGQIEIEMCSLSSLKIPTKRL